MANNPNKKKRPAETALVDPNKSPRLKGDATSFTQEAVALPTANSNAGGQLMLGTTSDPTGQQPLMGEEPQPLINPQAQQQQQPDAPPVNPAPNNASTNIRKAL